MTTRYDLDWLRSKASPTKQGCWEWRHARHSTEPGKDYGLSWYGPKKGVVLAHRLAFFIANGSWPNICRHTCDNPPCVNPAHLLDGDVADNNRDRDSRHRGGWLRGEAHASARLTDAQVAEMRALYAAGGHTQGELGRRFGVGQSQVWRIVRNKVRTHHEP